MLVASLIPIIIFAAKLCLYAWWCSVGFTHLNLSYPRHYSFYFALLRIFLGFTFLGLILLLNFQSIFNLFPRPGDTIHLDKVFLVYLPITWITWSITEFCMNKSKRTVSSLLLGFNNQSRMWRFCGVLLSCGYDLPFMWLGYWVAKGLAC